MLATGLATSGFGAAISGGWNTTYIAPPSPAPTPVPAEEAWKTAVFVGFPPVVQSHLFLSADNATRVVWTEGGECDGWTIQHNSKVSQIGTNP